MDYDINYDTDYNKSLNQYDDVCLVECRWWTYRSVLVHEIGSVAFLNSLLVLFASSLFLLHLRSKQTQNTG